MTTITHSKLHAFAVAHLNGDDKSTWPELAGLDLKPIVANTDLATKSFGGDELADAVSLVVKAIKDGYEIDIWYGEDAEILIMAYRKDQLKIDDSLALVGTTFEQLALELANRFDDNGCASERLDEMVHETMQSLHLDDLNASDDETEQEQTIGEGERLAADINNGGLYDQIYFLLENDVPVEDIEHQLQSAKPR